MKHLKELWLAYITNHMMPPIAKIPPNVNEAALKWQDRHWRVALASGAITDKS